MESTIGSQGDHVGESSAPIDPEFPTRCRSRHQQGTLLICKASAPQEFEYLCKRSASMAEAVLDLRLQFAKSFRISLRDKHAVVTELFGTTLLWNDSAFDSTCERA